MNGLKNIGETNMKKEYFYETNKAEKRGFWFLAFPMIFIILVGGYFLTRNQPYEPDVHKEYERPIYYHTKGHVNSIKIKDTTIRRELSNWNNIEVISPLLNN